MDSQADTSWVGRHLLDRTGSRRAIVWIVLAIVITMNSSPVLAQDNETKTDTDAKTLEEVVVEAEREEPPSLMKDPPPANPGGHTASGMKFGPFGNLDHRDIPFSFTSYTDTAVEERQPIAINELLDDDPSVQRETARNTYFTGIEIRGLDAGYTFNGQPGVYGRDLVPSFEQFRRIDLLKSPNSIIGSNAPFDVGGVVNLVPKRATSREVTNMTITKLPGSAMKYHLDLGRRFGEDDAFGIRVNAVTEEGELNVEHVERQRDSLVLALDHRGENHRITLDIEQTDRETPGGQPWFQVSPGLSVPDAPELDRTYGQPWAQFDQEFNSMVLQGEYELTSNWTAGFAWSEVDLEEFGQWQGFATLTAPDGTYTWFTNANWTAEADYSTYRAYTKGRFRTGIIDHNLSLTAVHMNNTFSGEPGSSIIITSNLNNPNYVPEPSIPGRQVFPWTEDENDYVSFGDRMELSDHLSVMAGLQWADITSLTFNNSGTVSNRASSDDISPMAGINYDWNQIWTFYASYAESLEPGEQAPPGAVNAGESTDPSITEQLQFGGKFDYGRLSGDLAFFETEKPNTFLNAANVFGQNGLRRNEGVELTLTGETYRNLYVTGGVTWMDAELVETQGGTNEGNWPIATPEWKGTLNVRYDDPRMPGLSYSAGLYHTGDQYLDNANNQLVPDYTTADLGVSYSFTWDRVPMTAQLDVKNVTNEQYWNTSTIGLIPGNPLSSYLSLKAEF